MMKSATALMFLGTGVIDYDQVQWPSQGCPTTAEGNSGKMTITGLDLGFDLGQTGGHAPVPQICP